MPLRGELSSSDGKCFAICTHISSKDALVIFRMSSIQHPESSPFEIWSAPPVVRDGRQALNQYLRRSKIWMALREAAEHVGEQLTSYSLRHRWAEGMHAANVPFAKISDAIGHTI